MTNEVARALTDFLNDADNGIVPMLALIPRDDGDPLPDVGTIADYTRNNLVAQGRYPSVPGVAVNIRQIPVLDGDNNTVTGDGYAEVFVRIVRSNVDTAVAASETSYILRAVLKSWRRFNAATRERNQIQIYHCDKLAVTPDWTTIDDTIATGSVSGCLYFRDLFA